MTMTNSDEYARSGDGGKWEYEHPIVFTWNDVSILPSDLTPEQRKRLKLMIKKLRKTSVTVTLHTDSDDKGDE